MRLAPLVIVLFIIHLTIGFVDVAFNENLDAYGNSLTNYPFAMILQPWNWQGNSLYFLFAGIVAAATGIAVTGLVLGRSDLVLLQPIFIIFVSVGAIPIINLYSFVTRHSATFACTVGESCFVSNIFGAITAGFLGIIWMFACLEWWAWRPTTQ